MTPYHIFETGFLIAVPSPPGPVPIRLMNGSTICSGRVEVFHICTWGSVCGDHWGMEEANVVCRLLNCGEATSATGNATFGQGTGPVWLSDMRCEGTEVALDQCPAKPYGNNNCSHSQDAGVTCSGKEISGESQALAFHCQETELNEILKREMDGDLRSQEID
uniref:Soluble scavenger receptor cysteine-rich domain-containing protein SSC5D n=1 Tax=Callorhinchus milii TaxID=7868 RepID=A0A4W3HF20_CALMI